MKLLILFPLSFLLFSCTCKGEADVVGKDTPAYLQSYIVEYIEGDPILQMASKSVKDGLWLRIDSNSPNYKSYPSFDFTQDTEASAKFLEIARQYNDLSYNRYDNWLSYHERICPATAFGKINIQCPHADWDASHPARADLGDIMQIELQSYANYIKNGYNGNGYEIIKKRVSELTENDLSLFCIHGGKSPRLYFDITPPSGTYTLKVTLTTTDGQEYATDFTMKFD